MAKTYAWNDESCPEPCCCDPQTGKCSPRKTIGNCADPFVWSPGGESECPPAPEDLTAPETPCSELAVYECEGPEECTCTYFGKSLNEVSCNDKTEEEWFDLTIYPTKGLMVGECSCDGGACRIIYTGNCHYGGNSFTYTLDGNNDCSTAGANMWVLQSRCGEDCIEDGTHPGGDCTEGETRYVPCKECFKYICEQGVCNKISCAESQSINLVFDTPQACQDSCGGTKYACLAGDGCVESQAGQYSTYVECKDGCQWGACCHDGDCLEGYWTALNCHKDNFSYPDPVFHRGRSCKSPEDYPGFGLVEEPPCGEGQTFIGGTGSCCTKSYKTWSDPGTWSCSNNRTSLDCYGFQGPGPELGNYEIAEWTKDGECNPFTDEMKNEWVDDFYPPTRWSAGCD